MICAGWLVLVSSGLCTGYVSFFSLAEMIHGSAMSRYATVTFWIALAVGAPAILMGIALIFGDRRLNRS
jgi:hypothetical protein